ncbi:unnamed protein product [Vicia faba]|uniref:DNA helicase Pif1-like 2B domain-containing protein n=1 Tax=Vicia faba TaxID=3906 RepID=A0AAV1A0L9_VICFA|nr:unnamed protein product [Vicia faba]
MQLSNAQLKNLTLIEIEIMMQSNRRSLHEFKDMPYPDSYVTRHVGNRLIYDELDYNADTERENFHNLFTALTDEQRSIFNKIMDVVNKKRGGVFFFTWLRRDCWEIINHYALDIISGEEKEYLSFDSIDRMNTLYTEAYEGLTPEFFSKLRTSGLPNHKIKLKVGTPIMLLRNMDQSDGLCNGTRLIVTRLANHVIEAKIMSGKNIGNIFYIPRMSVSPSESPWSFKLIRRQFPIIVSYAMTINKSQCQSLESVGLYFPTPVFSHGQLYVTISRVTTKSSLKILIHDKENAPSSTTINVVYKEVFQSLC